ncbi:MAG: S8 family serine peptidase, partial [Muribaculaceae bacterium]|nr:S8 family serine peptidase [Muribaculaceae bacterium]
MKKLLLLTLLFPGVVCAQARFSHLDNIELGRIQAAETARLLKDAGARGAAAVQDVSQTPLTIFMRVADDATVGRVEAAGGEVSLRAGNILIVETTVGQAEALAAVEGVVTVSLPQELTMNAFTSPVGIDASREWLGLDKIQAAAAPLKQAYTGEGVIVGVLDGGIDPNHVMFDDAEGNPRVKRIINHVQVGSNKLAQKMDTPEKIRKFKSDNTAATHGTHVMGIAAGSFDAGPDGPNLMGAAPGADIAVKCGVADNARLIQGLKYITDYAAEENKPCVINISLGSNSGPHDGTDEFPAALQEYASMDNVTICVSSGNEGADQAFLYHEFTDEQPLKTIIWASNYTDYLYSSVSMFPLYPQAIGSLQVWSDDDTPVDIYIDHYELTEQGPVRVSEFKLEPMKVSYLTTTGRAPVKADVIKGDDETFNTRYHNSFVGGETMVYAANNRYYAELNFQLECESAEKYMGGCMSLRVEGTPGHKVYVYGLPLSSLFGYTLLSGGFEDMGFSGSVADGSVNAMAGAKDVISVGSFVSHNFNKDVASQYQVGTTSTFSSWGPTPDGRVHPLISAPGNFIVS